MVASKDSWKWKAAVIFIGFCVFLIGFIFTEWGRSTMVGWMNNAYNETPESERSTQKAADYWLMLAWIEGFVKTNNKQADEMYMEWLGILPDPVTKKSIFEIKNNTGTWKWSGKFDGRTKYGWGMMHERGPEAYYNFMRMWERDQSATYIGEYAMGYYTLFFKTYPSFSKTGKPHPQAYKYWGRIKIMMQKYQVKVPEVPKRPPEFPDEDPNL